MARKPRWAVDALTTEPLAFESLGEAKNLATIINTVFEPAVTPADITWLRDHWTGRTVVTGIRGSTTRAPRSMRELTRLPSPITAAGNSIEP